jgi:uncharacterized protein YcfL
MKKSLLPILIVCFLLTSCGSDSTSNSETNSNIEPTFTVPQPKAFSLNVDKENSQLEFQVEMPEKGTTFLFNVYNQNNEIATNIAPNAGIIRATNAQKLSLRMNDKTPGIYRLSLTNLKGESIDAEWVVE